MAPKVSKAAYRHQKGRCPKGSHFDPKASSCQAHFKPGKTHGRLFKRIHLTKKGREAGDKRGDKYWQSRNRRATKVAHAVGVELLLPGGTALNVARYLKSRRDKSKAAQKAKTRRRGKPRRRRSR